MLKSLVPLSAITIIIRLFPIFSPPPPEIEPLRGVYICGPEFGNRTATFSNENRGKAGIDFTFNSEKTFGYFASKGFSCFRIPLMWERLQPVLGKPLDRAYIELFKTNLRWAKKYGCSVIIEIINEARYTLLIGGSPVKCIIDGIYEGRVRVSTGDFCDLWTRISDDFKTNETVAGYCIMDEPHDMGGSDWKRISQSAVTAIRKNGDKKLILINGDGWSSCESWDTYNRTPWISDPINNYIYEASCYLDSNESGAYALSFDDELLSDPGFKERGVTNLKRFSDWCRTYRVRGSISESGIPGNDKRWLDLLDNILSFAEAERFGWFYWGAGEWWSGYKLSIQPGTDFTQDKFQIEILAQRVKHTESVNSSE
jgi:endoglucanase